MIEATARLAPDAKSRGEVGRGIAPRGVLLQLRQVYERLWHRWEPPTRRAGRIAVRSGGRQWSEGPGVMRTSRQRLETEGEIRTSPPFCPTTPLGG